MKAFTVHGVFKIARFTDAPCISTKILLILIHNYMRKKYLH